MECQEVRQLLAFFERKSEEFDAVERDALQKHLDACPDCAALSAQERGMDQAIGTAMRDVPIPAGLKQQVLQRVARERGGKPWKRWAAAAAVAAALLTAIGGGWLAFSHKPEFALEERNVWTKEDVQSYLHEHGCIAPAPSKVRYDLLRKVDIVILQGQPVPRLSFSGNNGESATLFIVDKRRFNVDKISNDGSVHKHEDGRFLYLIHPGNDLAWLRPDII